MIRLTKIIKFYDIFSKIVELMKWFTNISNASHLENFAKLKTHQ